MRKNSTTVLQHSHIFLVPYKSAHVPQYHEWMKDAELQQLTASEPLDLDQEYEMQESWYNDDKKCTFIVQSTLATGDMFGLGGMVGDVNLYFNDMDDDSVAELEIMIAEKSMRRNGIGRIATLMMMRYGVLELGIKKFVVKISLSNEPSLRMFSNFGFKESSRSDYFKEVTLERIVDQLFLEQCKIEYTSFNKDI